MLWISNWILISKFLYTYVKSTFYIQRLPFAAQNLFTKFYSVWILSHRNFVCIMHTKSTFNSLSWQQNICICKYGISFDLTTFSYVLSTRVIVLLLHDNSGKRPNQILGNYSSLVIFNSNSISISISILSWQLHKFKIVL